MNKKPICIILSGFLILSIVIIPILVLLFPWPQFSIDVPHTLIYGISSSPSSLDPLDAMDKQSKDVVTQVSETLFWNNLEDAELPLEPLLVDDFSWNPNYTKLTVILKMNILFHDGEDFDASSVEWNVNRWLYFTNASGTLPKNISLAKTSRLFFHTDGTPIINQTITHSKYNITFILNKPFAPFLSLLTHPATSILSPLTTPDNRYIQLNEEIIGTGPFIYINYVPNVEVRFQQNWRFYWRTPPYLDSLIFAIIPSAINRNTVLGIHQIDFLEDNYPLFLEMFEADPLISVINWSNRIIYNYIGFNTHSLNITWRKAISYACNYTYVNNIKSLDAKRGFPAIPTSMPGYNHSVFLNLPNFNISHGRVIMQSMGLGINWDILFPGENESLWLNANFSTQRFGSPLELNNDGSGINLELNKLLVGNLALIGIDCVQINRTREEFINLGENHPEQLQLWYDYWIPDYFEPYSILNPLFNSFSSFNFIQLNDSKVQTMFEELIKLDLLQRIDKYKQLQYYLFERLYAHIPIFTEILRFTHTVEVTNISYNVMEKFYAYPIRR